MTMLSRVAQRLYWLSRYLERAEDTARLTNAYVHLIMDIPTVAGFDWDVLVDILDAQPDFAKHYRVHNEQNVLKFLIADEDNPSSIRFAVKQARENMRTTRDALPQEVWEHVNELYLYVEEYAAKSVGRRNRYGFLEQVMTRCQMIGGLMNSTLSRDHAYRFIKMGYLLERADMTTRVIDVGVAAIFKREVLSETIDPLLWGSLLKSLSALGTYRRAVGPLVDGDAVVEFVFKERTLPRSVLYCLLGIKEEMKPLRNNEEAQKITEHARRRVSRLASVRMPRQRLHTFIDELQMTLNALNTSITDTWFSAGEE
ncbi:MAG: hypothetical protein CSA53_02595 [Gammaproteobacteria bacterium]|nr:MAG: hypothetical protein CSA53_02595 [Gammaproteobacteria bacterium]